jgi:hypothetical protein
MLGFGGIAVVCFLVPYVQVVLVTGDWLWMSHLVKRRALSNVSDANATFTLWDWIRGALYGHAIVRHTWAVMILALMWIIRSIVHVTQRRPAVCGTRPTALLLGWAILHIAVGRQGVFVHEWWWWPLTPGVALAAGLMVDRMCAWLESRGVGHIVTNGIVALMLIVFAAWHTRHAVDELSRPKIIAADDPALDYTIDEIGALIRESASPNAVVMLAENDSTLSLWYYADRPLRTNIWDPWTFEQRLSDDSSELPFNLSEPHPGRAVVFIFPKAYRAAKTESFLRYLSSRFPVRDAGKFYVFDLTRPSS